MKKIIFLIGIIVFLSFIGCNNNSNDNHCSHNWEWRVTSTDGAGIETETCSLCDETRGTRYIKSINPIYYLSGVYYDIENDIEGIFTIDKNSIIIKLDNEELINILGVYTSNVVIENSNWSWAYLFNSSGKIGFISIDADEYLELGLGYTECYDSNYGSIFDNPPDFSDMKDDYKGFGRSN